MPVVPPESVQRFGRSVMRFFAHHYFRLEFEGQEHVPAEGGAMIVANHPTYLDPFTLGFGVRRWITWMAWADAFRWPGFGWVLEQMGAFGVDTDRPASSTLKAARGVLREGRLLGIFIEGGRSAPGEFGVSEPRPGPARIALKAGTPVVPVSIAGARRLWPLERRLPRPGKVVVRYHPPIDPAGVAPGASSRERAAQLTDAIVAAIRSGLPPDGRPHRWSQGSGRLR